MVSKSSERPISTFVSGSVLPHGHCSSIGIPISKIVSYEWHDIVVRIRDYCFSCLAWTNHFALLQELDRNTFYIHVIACVCALSECRIECKGDCKKMNGVGVLGIRLYPNNNKTQMLCTFS